MRTKTSDIDTDIFGLAVRLHPHDVGAERRTACPGKSTATTAGGNGCAGRARWRSKVADIAAFKAQLGLAVWKPVIQQITRLNQIQRRLVDISFAPFLTGPEPL